MHLKSGAYGTSSYLCQHDVICQSGWNDEARSVVFLLIEYIDNNNNRKRLSGTGFFPKKVNGYGDYDYPILVTCGHLFAPIVNGSIQDISNSFLTSTAIVDYENKTCDNDPSIRRGISIFGNFTMLNIGSSYNLAGQPSYTDDGDYAIMQSPLNVRGLRNYNVMYAGWSNNYNLSNSNNKVYTCIGHPGGDTKKISIDNGAATTSANNFLLHYDYGLPEGGSSGSPIFNSSKQVIGWHCRSNSSKACQYVGQDVPQNTYYCGTFSRLSSALSSYIDPTGVGETPSSNPTPPTPPAHCSNCIKDGDETGIDCGGSCYPCGMADVLSIKASGDLLVNKNVKSRYEIYAEPDANNQLVLNGGTYSFDSGMNIELKSGFAVAKGTNFSATINQELMSAPPRGCQSPCIRFNPGLSPNGDGSNDYWLMGQAFISEYSIQIFNRWGGSNIYSAYNRPIFQNGAVNLWDGTGAHSNGTYYAIVTYKDCNGVSHATNTTLSLSGLTKSALTDSIYVENNDYKTKSEKNILEKLEILIFPNPAKDRIYIQSTSCESHNYYITDMSGKTIKKGTILLGSETVDVSKFPQGTYIIKVKNEGEIITEKIIIQR